MSTPRQEAARASAALAASKALDRATKAMNRYMSADRACGGRLEADDSRVLLVRSMSEYSGYLFAKFNVPLDLIGGRP